MKARLPTVVRLKDGTISCSEVDDRSLDRDGTPATRVKYNDRYPNPNPNMFNELKEKTNSTV